MDRMKFAKGMGMGVLAGTAIAVGAALLPKKKHNMKAAAGKTLRTVGEVLEDLSDSMR